MPLLKSLFFIGLCSVGFTCVALADDALPFLGEFTGNGINIRADSTVNSGVLCVAKQGEKIEVVSQRYDWYKVKLPQNTPAFIRKDLLAVIEKPADSLAQTPPAAALPVEQTARVLKDNVNVRYSASESSVVIGRVSKNQVVRVLGEESGWCRIDPSNNSYGWVHKNFVKPVPAPLKIETPAITSGTGSAKQKFEAFGVVAPYGMVFMRKATHKLVSDDKKIYLLKGDKRTLNNLNRRRVKVTGELLSIPEEKDQLIQVEKIEVVD